MKHIKTSIIAFLLLVVAIQANAQQLYRFGYISYNEVLKTMPEFVEAQKSMIDLKAKYDAETKRNEESFNKMFADYLQGQKDFPQTIMLKRQKELQEAMEKGISFREDVKRLLSNAEQDMQKPIIAKLDSAITLVGMEKGYEYVINTDDKAFPFIHKGCGENITEFVKAKLLTIKN